MIRDCFKRCGVAVAFAAMQLAGHGTAQAQDPTAHALDLFLSVCLDTLPSHADAARRARAIGPDFIHEDLSPVYEGFSWDTLTVAISIDHPGQNSHFCNVDSHEADRERLQEIFESRVAEKLEKSLEPGKPDIMNAFDLGSWQLDMPYGTLHIGLISMEEFDPVRGATLTVIRNVE